MTRLTYVGMSEDMKTAFKELVECLLEYWDDKTQIVDTLARCVDPTTEFFAELSELIMDASTR